MVATLMWTPGSELYPFITGGQSTASIAFDCIQTQMNRLKKKKKTPEFSHLPPPSPPAHPHPIATAGLGLSPKALEPSPLCFWVCLMAYIHCNTLPPRPFLSSLPLFQVHHRTSDALPPCLGGARGQMPAHPPTLRWPRSTAIGEMLTNNLRGSCASPFIPNDIVY